MTTFLSFNENFNSKLTFTAEDSAETEEMLRKDLPLSHRWSVWEQIMPTSESKGIYADATQKVASFGTVQDFWRFWNHIPQPSELLEQKRLVREHPDGLRVIDALMIFQENIRPEWEDKMNANGGHFQFQLKPSCGGGQIDEYWNNLVMGMIGATIDPPNMITGVRLVDKLSGPRASNVIRIEVWFTENEDSQAIGTLRKNVEKCMAHKLDGAHGTPPRCDTKFHATGKPMDDYPLSYPPLGIFGSAAEVLFLGKTLKGYVFNHTTPLTASELEAAVVALQRQGSGLLGPVDGPWLARFTVAAVALLTAGILSKLLRRPLPKGVSEPLLASP